MDHIGQPVKDKFPKPILARYLAAVLLPIFFVVVSIYFGAKNIYKQYIFTQKEIIGTETVRYLFYSIIDLQRIRGLSHIDLNKKVSTPAIARQDIMKRFRLHLNTPQWQKLSHYFAIEKEMKQALLASQELFDPTNFSLNEDLIFSHYTDLIEKIYNIMLIVAYRSNLIIDPELDTYYLAEVAVKKIPDLCESFAIMRGIGSGLITHKNITKNENDLFQNIVSIASNELTKFARANSILHWPSDEFEIDKTTSLFLQTSKSLNNGKLNLSAEAFFLQGSDAIDSLRELFIKTVNKLDLRLKKRLSYQLQLLMMILVGTLAAAASIFYFYFSFYRLQQASYLLLEKISITDPLTSIPNRRYLTITCARELSRAKRDGKGLAFGLLDVDHFKQFNDIYGHHEGDIALQKVAGILESSLHRAGDYYFRFGGEEFCFLFSTQSLAEVEMMGERIRVTIEQLEIQHLKNNVSPFLTASIGLVFVPNITNEDLVSMIKVSDDLLYKAKDNGRNQCTIATIT